MTFCHIGLAAAWPSSPVQSVNEMEDPGGIAGTIWLEERLSVCERWLRWTCSTNAGSGLCGCGGGVVLLCLLVLTRLYCIIGIVCRLLVGFRWLVKISWRMGLLEEQDGVVVGVPASGPS